MVNFYGKNIITNNKVTSSVLIMTLCLIMHFPYTGTSNPSCKSSNHPIFFKSASNHSNSLYNRNLNSLLLFKEGGQEIPKASSYIMKRPTDNFQYGGKFPLKLKSVNLVPDTYLAKIFCFQGKKRSYSKHYKQLAEDNSYMKIINQI